MKMNGQWMGNALVTTTDTTDYLCMLNLDLKDESYEGRVLLFYLPFQKVSSVAQVKINKKDFESLIHLDFTLPSFSYLEPLSIGNNRMLPQQSVSMFSSIDDIEGYIKNRGKEKNHEYLKIYDLPVKDRTKVIRELDYMGITVAALFPGLDGVCTALKE